MPKPQFIHVTDEHDVLVEVNQPWLDFARANWDEGFSAERVLGSRIWGHIHDPSTSHLYQTILAAVKGRGVSVTVPYRCDSPTLRRFLEMEISALAGGLTRWSSRLVRAEERPPVPLLAADAPRSALFLTMCSWCKRFRVPAWTVDPHWLTLGGTWWEVEHVGEVMRGMARPEMPQMTHTVCPDCYHLIMESMREDVA